jgi:hypothetical protein
MNKKHLVVIFLITLCTYIQHTLALTTGISCLRHSITGLKVIILYDIHIESIINPAGQPSIEKVLRTQKEELEHLVDITANNENEVVQFFVECHQLRLGEISLGYYDQTLHTLDSIPKVFVKANTGKIGNAKINCADPRSYIDIFAACNFVSEFDQFKKQVEEDTLEPILTDITIGFYRKHIQKIYEEVMVEANSLLFLTPKSKDTVIKSVEQTYNKILDYINSAMKEHQLDETNHLLDLYEPYIKQNNYHNFINIVDWGSVVFDVRLLHIIDYYILHTARDSNKLVVQTGSLHSKLLEHRLSQNGFEVIGTHGAIDQFTVNENDYVEQVYPTENLYPTLEDYVERAMHTGLKNIDKIVIDSLQI